MEFVFGLFERGGLVMWPLFVCSLLSVTIALERFCFWFRERDRDSARFITDTLDLAESGDYLSAIKNCSEDKNYIMRVVGEGLKHREHGLSDVMQLAANREVEKMKSGLTVLDTIITMAPLLGILGTVIGIIESFDLLGASGIEDPAAVTGGIAQALITTATGLSIALVTLMPYNYFVSRVQSAAKLLEAIGSELEIVYRKSAVRRS